MLSSLNLLANGICPAQARGLIALMESSGPQGKLRSAPRAWTLCSIKGDQTELDLSYLGIGAGCSVLLLNELKDHKMITYLNLSGNLLGAAGTKQIARALETNKKITVLDLSGCDICDINENGRGARDDSGVTAVVRALKNRQVFVLTSSNCLSLTHVSSMQEVAQFARWKQFNSAESHVCDRGHGHI